MTFQQRCTLNEHVYVLLSSLMKGENRECNAISAADEVNRLAL